MKKTQMIVKVLKDGFDCDYIIFDRYAMRSIQIPVIEIKLFFGRNIKTGHPYFLLGNEDENKLKNLRLVSVDDGADVGKPIFFREDEFELLDCKSEEYKRVKIISEV